MIDAVSILLTHGLIMLAVWRMLARDDLDVEPEPSDDDAGGPPPAEKRPWLANQKYLGKSEHPASRSTPDA